MIEEATLNAIRAAVGIDAVSTRPPDLAVYSSDLWPRTNVQRLAGQMPESRPDAVAWPRTAGAASRVVALCSEAGVPLVPYGAGSGVCGGAIPVRGGLVLDVKRMNRLLAVDDVSLTATAEAGINGQHLEDALNERGYTLGHFPSSIMCSTLGGWISTRSAGQFSSRYGKIEDMLVDVDAVLPDGSEVTIDGTQPHPGSPDWCQLVLGAEGTLGVVVRARVRIHPLPPARRFRGFRFLDLTAGLEAMRSIMQSGLRPAVMRLYDPLDTFLNSFSAWFKGGKAGGEAVERSPFKDVLAQVLGDAGGVSSVVTGPLLRQFIGHPAMIQRFVDRLPLGCMMIVGFEGDDVRTRDELDRARELALRATGRDLGPGPGEHWFKHRYSVSFKLTKIFGQGAFADTIEVAGLWRDVPRIYDDVRGAIRNRVAVMAHFSHAYREGCAVYFTLAGSTGDRRRLVGLYDWTIRMAVAGAMGAGSTVSHHHGIGLMKRAWTPEEYRGGLRLFGAVKEAIDPMGVMNPQKVYPPTVLPDSTDREDLRDAEHYESLLSWQHGSAGPVEPLRPDMPDEIPGLLKNSRRAGRHVSCQSGAGPRRSGKGSTTSAMDLSRLTEILDMDPVSGTVTVQAGMTVQQLENYLREKGYTIGYVPALKRHLPVGEYLATAPPGDSSPRYGSVRENCIGMSAVLADGTLFSARPSPRRAAGPDLMHCLIGGHGRYGVITAACLRVFPLPAVREAVAYALDDAVLAVSLVRSVLVREAAPEWALVLVRAPSQQGSRRRVRLVFQFGGNREAVSADLAVVRDVVGPLKLDEEPVRAEDRMTLPARRLPSIERFLPMRTIVDLLGRVTGQDGVTCPEAHVTHLGVHGATFRLLLREDPQAYPRDVLDVLRAREVPPPLHAAADRLKTILDPEGVMNGGNE
ncbi:MAG: FAD-binding oxidoreductase [Deltaproteobacteria bacterium]|nr:FAD-binding oxidoreductase [Deltaproteobacteria bacterium]